MNIGGGTLSMEIPAYNTRGSQVTFTFIDVDYDVLALVYGYRDAVDMFTALETHIIRGDN